MAPFAPISDGNAGSSNNGHPVNQAKFDSYRMALTQDDFKRIDTHNNGTFLDKQELDDALKSGGFDAKKQAAIRGLRDSIGSPAAEAAFGTNCHPEGVPSWFDSNFAKQQLNRTDVTIIDANRDDILSASELKTAKTSDLLSPMSRQAAGVLETELNAALNDPLLALTGGVKNWYKEQDRADLALRKLAHPEHKDGVPGVKIGVGDGKGIEVTAYDASGRPAKMDAGGMIYDLKYDDKGRVSEMVRTLKGQDQGITSKITYDDAKGTQTISQLAPDGTQLSSTVTQFDDKGRRVKEEFKDLNYGESRTSQFNDQDQINLQINVNPDGSSTRSEIEYDGDRKSVACTWDLDKNGKKLGLYTTQFDDNGEVRNDYRKEFDENGNLTKILTPHGSYRDAQLKVSQIGDHGQTLSVDQVKYEENPYLVSNLSTTDGQGHLVESAIPHYKMTGQYPQLDSIDYTDASGRTRTLSRASQGDDAKLMQKLGRKMSAYSNSDYFDPRRVHGSSADQQLSLFPIIDPA